MTLITRLLARFSRPTPEVAIDDTYSERLNRLTRQRTQYKPRIHLFRSLSLRPAA